MDLNEERVTFAYETLKPILDNYEPIIYVDESTFHLWDTKSSSWMPKKVLHSQLHPRKEKIIHFTWPLVIALLFHMCKWDLLKSTNSTNFSKFIRILGEHVIENLEVKPHIMYDGHRSH